MKKNIYLLVLMLLLSVGALKAQDQYKAFRLVLKATSQCLTNENGALRMADKKTGKNDLSQLFTIKRIDGNKVWIVSSLDNSLYVRWSGYVVVLDTYSDANDIKFQWDMIYAGGDYKMFATVIDPSVGLTASTSTGLAAIPKLTNLNDSRGDFFRFTLEEANTF